jgi:hypothetical protein
MASEILGLFTTPEQYQLAQRQAQEAQAIQFAQLDPMARANYGVYRAGQQLGGAIGGALGGEDPQLKLISMRQQLASQLNPNDPESYMKIAEIAAQSGDQQFAIAVADAGRKAMSEYALIQQRTRERQGADPFQQIIRSGKYTPASLSAYQKSGNVGDLVLLEKDVAGTNEIQNATKLALQKGAEGTPEFNAEFNAQLTRLTTKEAKDDIVVVGNALVSKTTGKPIYQGDKPEKYSAFAQELIDAGLQPDTEPFQRRMLDFINEKTKGAGKGTGNVTIGGISIDTGEAGKAAAKVIGANVANVESQYSLQTGVGDALKLIDKGIYAGAYGPEKGFVAKFSGGMIGDPKKVQNTEVFMANIGEIVIPRLQQFGGNDSNEELKYLQKVVAGDQRLEPESMKRILISAEKKIANNIRRLQKQAESGKTRTELPLEPMQTTPSAPRVTKRLNPQTGKIEAVSGD